MDPYASDPSLLTTLPNTDPAALYQLTAEVSAQASMLASHHHSCNDSPRSRKRWQRHYKPFVSPCLSPTFLHPFHHKPFPVSVTHLPAHVWHLPRNLTAHRKDVRVSYYNAPCLLINNRSYTLLKIVRFRLFVHC